MSLERKLLEDLASKTWKRIYHSLAWQISQGEETITDNLLLELKMSQLPAFLKIEKCPKNLERLKGIDWEWWIGSFRFGWVKYAVQAKKISLNRARDAGKYLHLNHMVKMTANKKLGRPASATKQIEILKDYAKLKKCTPVYCFYNYIIARPTSYFYQYYWHCDQTFDLGKRDYEQLGCTVTPLRIVEQALISGGKKSKRTFEFIHTKTETLPWRCLVQCSTILDIYRKNYSQIKKLPLSMRSEKRVNTFDNEVFGEVHVHNTGPDDLPGSVPRMNEAENGPRRLMILDIDDTIASYIGENEVG